jgi:hypothetical protein
LFTLAYNPSATARIVFVNINFLQKIDTYKK